MTRATSLFIVLSTGSFASCGRVNQTDGPVRSESALTNSTVSSVLPLPGCVSKISATSWRATFGYESTASRAVLVAVGTQNGFSPGTGGLGQPERFEPGRHKNAFSVAFGGSPLSWTLGTNKVSVSSTSPACLSTTNAVSPLLNSFVLYARTAIRMDRAQVVGGDVGVLAVGQTADGRDELSIEPDGLVDPTHALFANTVDLRARVKVGPVLTARIDNSGATSFGPVGAFPATMPALPSLSPIQPGLAPVNVTANHTLPLAAGSYGLVHVDGTLTLTGGTYQIAGLQIGNGGKVEASSSVRLRVAGQVTGGPGAHLRTNPVGSARDLLIEIAGSGPTPALLFDSDSEIHAIINAPSGQMVFHPRVRSTGAFAAHDMVVNADAFFQYEGGFSLPIADCMASLQLKADELPSTGDANTLPRMISAAACFTPNYSTCQTTFVANVTFDQRSAAKQLVANLFTPAQYLWLSRDRTRKLRLASQDPSWTPAFCRGDADGDLVPDDRDTCPSTPPLTATDDHGCISTTLPPAPTPAGVQRTLTHAGVLFSLTCDGAPQPTIPYLTDVCLDRPNLRYLLTVRKTLGQPSLCHVWYEMMTSGVEQFEARETFVARLGFENDQSISETADTITFAEPLVCDPTHETPGDGKSWPCDEVNGDAFDTVIAVRATNGIGQQSPWSSARKMQFHLCH